MVNDEPCKIVGNYKLYVKLQNINQLLLKYARHIPNVRRNIIATRKLGSEMYSCIYFMFMEGHNRISDNGKRRKVIYVLYMYY